MYKKKILILLSLLSLNLNIICSWFDVIDDAKNAVVQVISNYSEYNWLTPFQSPKYGQGSGSGFFINEDGYILTNYHVIKDCVSAYVRIPSIGMRELDVVLVGSCPGSDVALLKLTPEAYNIVKNNLKTINYLKLGDSDKLRPSEPVLALGYPLGERYLKTTDGVFSGITFYPNRPSFLQMTAPINPGNSGGPLLNRKSEVIGINTAGNPKYQNTNFIIPINDILTILDDLFKKTFFHKPFFGAFGNKTTEAHCNVLNNPKPAGFYITYITKNSVAGKLGLKPGDVLYQIDEYEVDCDGDITVEWFSVPKVRFELHLVRKAPGEKIDIIAYRNGEKLIFSGKFEVDYKDFPIRTIHSKLEPEELDYEMFAGLCVMQLRQNHLEKFGKNLPMSLIKYSQSENIFKNVLIITTVLPGSTIESIDCFYPGALLDKINDQKVRTLKDLREALLLSKESGNIKITAKDKSATVLTLKEVLEDELRIAKAFGFEMSKTLKQLQAN